VDVVSGSEGGGNEAGAVVVGLLVALVDDEVGLVQVAVQLLLRDRNVTRGARVVQPPAHALLQRLLLHRRIALRRKRPYHEVGGLVLVQVVLILDSRLVLLQLHVQPQEVAVSSTNHVEVNLIGVNFAVWLLPGVQRSRSLLLFRPRQVYLVYLCLGSAA